MKAEKKPTAAPVYRCARCFRRREDHRLPLLSCIELSGSTFELIPYASHPPAPKSREAA